MIFRAALDMESSRSVSDFQGFFHEKVIDYHKNLWYIYHNEKRIRSVTSNRIVHIDLTAFFVSVERILNPDLVGKPIMVAGPPESRGVVTCASYEIRPYGIHAGMPTAQALRKCPIAIRVDSHFHSYAEYSKKVQDFLKSFAPVFEVASVDEFYMDWTGCERLFGGNLKRFAEDIQHTILREFGLPCALGIASNKSVAKIACDHAKPYGVLEIHPGEEAEFLKPLGVEVISGVGEVMEGQLHLRGIRTCGQLAAMDSEYLGRTFGKWGLHVQERAKGRGSEHLTVEREQKQISKEETFASDTRDKAFLNATLHSMTLNVSEQLRAMDLKAQCVHVKLRYSDWVTHTRQITVPPTNDPAFIYQTALKLLDKADERRVTIRLVGMGLSKFLEDCTTINMFRQKEERREWLLKTIDKINHRYDDTLVKVGCGV